MTTYLRMIVLQSSLPFCSSSDEGVSSPHSGDRDISSVRSFDSPSVMPRLKINYQSVKESLPIPDLIDVQRESFSRFLQKDIPSDKRLNVGLQAVFSSTFPVKDPAGRFELDFIEYALDEPVFNVDDCRRRSISYCATLRAKFNLTLWEIEDIGNGRTVREFKVRKEQDIFVGDIPLMTDTGTFVINGVERVIVSQMHRSPGIFFDHDRGRNTTGRPLFSARVIPYRGAWLDFSFDTKDIIHVRIDRRRKFPVTTLLMALEGKSSDNEGEQKKGKKPSADKESADKNSQDSAEYHKQSSHGANLQSGMTREEILKEFYHIIPMTRQQQMWRYPLNLDSLIGRRLPRDLIDAKNGDTLMSTGDKVTRKMVATLSKKNVVEALVSSANLSGYYLASQVVDPDSGEVLLDAGGELTEQILQRFDQANINQFECLDIDNIHVGSYIRNTLVLDRSIVDRASALEEIFRMVRPSEMTSPENCAILLRDMLHDPENYDLSAVGRVKMNSRLSIDDGEVDPETMRTLRKEDIILLLKVLVSLRDGRGEPDDIDHLGNRRVRAVGELMENQCRVGLMKVERTIRERFSALDFDSVMPNDLINSKPIGAALREFLSSSQLSQFIDQTNPLSEITHKRRLSALGPGGLSRERAGFEVRDVHPTHYGRICPVETPEGPNIGLINSLAMYARVNTYGFIETPYRNVKDGVVTNDVRYLSAFDEERYNMARSDCAVDDQGKITSDSVLCRRGADFENVAPSDVNYVDVSPTQMVSVAASLIPFLENDDANRALMGSNMQRQAVPLLVPQAPLVVTGMEGQAARDSGALLLSHTDGVVDSVDSRQIVVRTHDDQGIEDDVVIYNLKKFHRSNHNTCINQVPMVWPGASIKKGDILADGSACERGELALGRNILVAFMPWNGYNFEDSIVISEKIVQDDVFTSVHINELEAVVRDTKLGEESITRDIPNVSEEAKVHLDEAGIAYEGARVEGGEILVGKVTPKGETPATPEEKLLRSIFGEKVSYVSDTSLRLPTGGRHTVIDVRIFNRRGVDPDERLLSIERDQIRLHESDRNKQKTIHARAYHKHMTNLAVGKVSTKAVGDITAGSVIEKDQMKGLKTSDLRSFVFKSARDNKQAESLYEHYQEKLSHADKVYHRNIEKLQTGSDLQPGVMKVVKVFVATKSKLQPGDKMAGRHGNKGVISAVMPSEDMPFLPDGRPVDMVLNPLGVPSRMNIGQILETHLGWACAGMGRKINDMVAAARAHGAKDLRDKMKSYYTADVPACAKLDAMSDDEVIELAKSLKDGIPVATPVFDGIREQQISDLLNLCGLDRSGQVQLLDGRTGEQFDHKTTVGYIYMLKLHHLVEDKMHARSTGPYSLVTQQPLGGKAHFGGQRLGEMEVWALQAYGAAYTLQELLTVKSDDVSGRAKIYESIVRGGTDFESGLPESFNVLIKELRSLCLNIDLLKDQDLNKRDDLTSDDDAVLEIETDSSKSPVLVGSGGDHGHAQDDGQSSSSDSPTFSDADFSDADDTPLNS